MQSTGGHSNAMVAGSLVSEKPRQEKPAQTVLATKDVVG